MRTPHREALAGARPSTSSNGKDSQDPTQGSSRIFLIQQHFSEKSRPLHIVRTPEWPGRMCAWSGKTRARGALGLYNISPSSQSWPSPHFTFQTDQETHFSKPEGTVGRLGNDFELMDGKTERVGGRSVLLTSCSPCQSSRCSPSLCLLPGAHCLPFSAPCTAHCFWADPTLSSAFLFEPSSQEGGHRGKGLPPASWSTLPSLLFSKPSPRGKEGRISSLPSPEATGRRGGGEVAY